MQKTPLGFLCLGFVWLRSGCVVLWVCCFMRVTFYMGFLWRFMFYACFTFYAFICVFYGCFKLFYSCVYGFIPRFMHGFYLCFMNVLFRVFFIYISLFVIFCFFIWFIYTTILSIYILFVLFLFFIGLFALFFIYILFFCFLFINKNKKRIYIKKNAI